MADDLLQRKKRPKLLGAKSQETLYRTAIYPGHVGELSREKLLDNQLLANELGAKSGVKSLPNATFEDYNLDFYKDKQPEHGRISDQQRRDIRKLLGNVLDEETILNWFPGLPAPKRNSWDKR